VATLAKVIGATVNNNGAAEDALRADQLDELVGDGALGVALAIRLEVAQVANVTLLVRGSTVGLVLGVDLVMVLASVIHHDQNKTHSEGRQRCSRWCCHQRRECACHAQRRHRGQ
jgi:hypothetical protein